MKKYLIRIIKLVCFSSLSVVSYSHDILTLINQQVFIGKVTRISECAVHFKIKQNTFEIPADSIFSIQFEDTLDMVYRSYLALPDSSKDHCLRGISDAKNLHGKAGLHFALGLLFGPFAMIGTALSNPTPYKSMNTITMSQNKDLFTDPVYLKCYKHKAKSRNAGFDGLGWLTWIVVYILALSQ